MFSQFLQFKKLEHSVQMKFSYESGLGFACETLLFAIKNLKKDIVLGIDGGSGSGKSKFAYELTQKVGEENVLLIKLDNYCIGVKRLKEIDKNELTDIQNWERPITRDLDFFAKDLKDLKLGKSVSLPKYSLLTGEKDGSVLSFKNKVIIVEGIFALDEKLDNLYDISIFVDCLENDRFSRRLARDTFDNIPKLQEYLLNTVSNMHQLHIEPNKRRAKIVVEN